jgi:hypothetical protein
MIGGMGEDRDLSVLVVPRVGAVEAGSDPWAPVWSAPEIPDICYGS